MNKRININEILRKDSLALTAIIEYWKENNTESVILAYAELNRRNFPIPNRTQIKLNHFCDKNFASIEILLNSFLKEKQFNSYEEFVKQFNTYDEFEIEKSAEKTIKIKKEVIEPSNIISAGIAIKNVVYAISMMIVILVIATLSAINSKNPDTIQIIYTLVGIASIVFNIYALTQLYSAGDKLENSVYQEE